MTCPACGLREDPFQDEPVCACLHCSVCHEPTDYLESYYDRHGIYSGRACSEKCGKKLPGQGVMANYDAEEPLDEC